MAKVSEELASRPLIARPGVTDEPVIPLLLPIQGRVSISALATSVTLGLADLISLGVSLASALLIRTHALPALVPAFPPTVPAALVEQLWWVLGIGLVCLAYEGAYSKRLPFWREAKRLVRAVTLAFLLTFAIVSLGKLSTEVSRTVLVMGYILSLALLPLGRLAAKSAMARLGLGAQPVLILGAGKTGEMVARILLKDAFLGYRIAGFLDDAPIKQEHGAWVNGMRFPVLGGFGDAQRVMDETGVRDIILAAPGMQSRAMVELANRLQRRAASVTVIPDLFGVPVMGVEADYSFDEQLLSFRIRNRLANPLNVMAKRAFDVVVGTGLLIALLPVMALIVAAIRLDSRGPAIFAQRRIGRHGRPFKCYKFRTMYLNNEGVLDVYLETNPAARREWEEYAKLKGYDPRVTRVGRLLRAFSLDELPQLFNALKGDMSLIGPRPYLPWEHARLEGHASSILLARPGITGLWQVSGRNEIGFEGRLRLESWYVRNWSLWLDLTLLVRTVGVVLGRKGAY